MAAFLVGPLQQRSEMLLQTIFDGEGIAKFDSFPFYILLWGKEDSSSSWMILPFFL